MTIHGAKGLEWDVVLVPGLEKRSRVSRSRLLAWNEVTSRMRMQRMFCSLLSWAKDATPRR